MSNNTMNDEEVSERAAELGLKLAASMTPKERRGILVQFSADPDLTPDDVIRIIGSLLLEHLTIWQGFAELARTNPAVLEAFLTMGSNRILARLEEQFEEDSGEREI